MTHVEALLHLQQVLLDDPQIELKDLALDQAGLYCLEGVKKGKWSPWPFVIKISSWRSGFNKTVFDYYMGQDSYDVLEGEIDEHLYEAWILDMLKEIGSRFTNHENNILHPRHVNSDCYGKVPHLPLYHPTLYV